MDAIGIAAGVEATQTHRRGRIADIDHLKTGIPISDVGKVADHLYVPDLNGGDKAAAKHQRGRIADIDHLQTGALICNVGEVADDSAPRGVSAAGEAAAKHRRIRITDIDHLQAAHGRAVGIIFSDVGKVADDMDILRIPVTL